MVHLRVYFRRYYWVYLAVVGFFIGFALFTTRTVEAMAEATVAENSVRIVIDPGHGGEDGGATSCSGILESQFNLEIALRLEDLLHLLGHRTTMIRTTDTAVHTEGETIAQRKMSDLKNRVDTVNQTTNGLLISIHQNTFSESRYHGPQVFYAPTAGSRELAESLQRALIVSVDRDSNREIKVAESVYLMQHIRCTGVLVECGFLSNPEEEAKLRTPEYQRQLCCIIAATVSAHLNP